MTRPPPLCIRPPIIVSTRHLAAESAASAALALVQSPGLWEALATLALLISPDAEAFHSLQRTAPTTTSEANEAAALLEATDHAARTWAAIAFPHDAGLSIVPHLGKVT
jgi:hypothetical protein